MKISVRTEDLNYGLSMVLRASAVRPVKLTYEGVLVETQEDSLLLTCTDGEITIRCSVPAVIEEEGTVLLPARLFGDLIHYQVGDIIRMESPNDESVVRIVCGESKSNMVSMEASDYPDIEDVSGGTNIAVNCSRFRDAIGKVMFAVSTDESRKILTGVLTEVYPQEVVLVGIDGFRMSLQRIRQENQLPESAGNKLSFVIPGKIINEIGRMVPDDENEDCTVSFHAGRVMITFGTVKVYAPLLTGEFIDYQRILPKTWTTEISVVKNVFESAIDRCSLMAKEGKNNQIQFKLKKEGILEMSAKAEKGDVVDKMAISFEGNELDIAFNSRYLLDVIRNISTERIKMCFNTNVSPCMVLPPEGNEYVFLVLPLRVYGQ